MNFFKILPLFGQSIQKALELLRKNKSVKRQDGLMNNIYSSIDDMIGEYKERAAGFSICT